METKARDPRIELLVATAGHERPGLASTRYANVPVYIHLEVYVRAATSVNNRTTDMEENPISRSMTQTTAIWTCFSHTQAYPTTHGGSQSIANFELSKRIFGRCQSTVLMREYRKYSLLRATFLRSLQSSLQAPDQTNAH
jgi:hypothetical protein